ncbi:hypothetical protein BDFB_006136 [Asbolus verrucosus]|uniref:Uncharacterized protein n=1 Tax=Asbolus verrucosus TaxID=1661398 RepID=A0A482VRD8_ASBVE|nr:hypothetical protein BDFB_006136 [Asbolus verrucosus]
MTSFKNKITNRKQKNSKAVNGQVSNAANPDPESAPAGKKQQKSGKHRNRGGKKAATEKGGSDANPENTSRVTPPALSSVDADDIIPADDLGLADVVLRTSVPAEVAEQNYKNSNQKRFSDSFVIENGLSRAVGGILIPEELYTNDKASKKGRRLSDLFRHGTLKTTNSVENLNIKQIDNNLAKTEKEQVKTPSGKGNADTKSKRQKKGTTPGVNKSTLAKDAKNSQQSDQIDKQNLENVTNSTTNSYLKRVKSKIYKTKSEGNGILPSKTNVAKKSTNCERIPEDAAVGTQSDLKKPSNFDFRLIRQTSNLENIRSKTFGLIKSTSNTGIADLGDGDSKPSQPVSRSGSDRRPDIVREEILKSAEGGASTTTEHGQNKQENETSAPDNVASFPATAKKRSSSNINRSESVKEQSEKRKQRRNISDPSHNTTRSSF